MPTAEKDAAASDQALALTNSLSIKATPIEARIIELKMKPPSLTRSYRGSRGSERTAPIQLPTAIFRQLLLPFRPSKAPMPPAPERSPAQRPAHAPSAFPEKIAPR